MTRGRKPSNIDYVIDVDRLRRLRREKGLTLRQVEAATGIKPGNLCDFEHGRIMLQLHRVKELLRLYEVDLLEAHDILRLRLIDARLQRDFRRACARHGTTPAEALEDFLTVFTYHLNDPDPTPPK
jgi:transcriptional regulator with XRE-family HTH domain